MQSKTIIIAEAGVNHNGDIQLAKELISVAADAGVDYVKFQTFKTEKLVSKEAAKAAYQIANTQSKEESQFDMIKRLELDVEAHGILIDTCDKYGIRFLSTAFDLESLDLLDRLGLDCFKVPSGEITNLPYLRKMGALNKPIILSTGMAKLGEIEAAIDVLESAGTSRSDITVLHCNTEYPTPMKDVNLSAMISIREAFGISVGYSDHTLGIEIPVAAVALGATVIEKHFTLDRNMKGPDHKASLEPHELAQMVSMIRNIEIALGDGIKRPSQSEIKNIPIARKSIHLARDVYAGKTVDLHDFIMKRPGDGISPMRMDELIGRIWAVDKEAGRKAELTDFS